MDGESIEKNSKKKYLLCFIGVMIYYFQGISTALNENNTIYALEQINRYDQNIFADNIAVYVDGVSARFFMNWVVSFCMKFSNGSWVGAAVPLIYFGCVILAVATVEMVFHISEKYRELLVIFLAVLLRKNVNTGFPGWGSFEMASLGMGIGFAFAMLAAAQVVGRKQNWTGAWLFLSIATLCHIHEGMWGGGIFSSPVLSGDRKKGDSMERKLDFHSLYSVSWNLCISGNSWGTIGNNCG